ncbi:cation transporter [bacterium]|nr:cation transporter [bacterium]
MFDQKTDRDIHRIRKITRIGFAFNLGLAGIKFLVGFLGSSQAVIADAVHSLSDMTTDCAVLFGVKFWSAPPDTDHPYGHKRIETLITVVIGMILAGAAVALGYHAMATIRDPHVHRISWIAFLGPMVSILLKELLYRWTVAIGSQVRSPAVIANAWHHRSDALSSIPALIAVAAAYLNPDWTFVDHIGAIIISLFILKVSWSIVRPAVSELSDHGVCENDREAIRQIACQVPGVQEVHAIRTRRLGPNIHVDLHILVNTEMSVREGHMISEHVKTALIDQGPDIIDVVVHLEPYE